MNEPTGREGLGHRLEGADASAELADDGGDKSARTGGQYRNGARE